MKMAVSIHCKLGELCSCAGPQLVVPEGAGRKGTHALGHISADYEPLILIQ